MGQWGGVGLDVAQLRRVWSIGWCVGIFRTGCELTLCRLVGLGTLDLGLGTGLGRMRH